MTSLKFGMVGRRRMVTVDGLHVPKITSDPVINLAVAKMVAEQGLPNIHNKAEMENRASIMASFLRFLRDHGLIKCKKTPYLSGMETWHTIQNLTYIAIRLFGLRPAYWYFMDSRGPFSPDLSADYYFVRDIGDHDPISLSVWPARDKFLKFVVARDRTRLDDIATLYFEHQDRGLKGEDLIEHVELLLFPTDARSAYDDLKDAGFFEEAASNT